MKILLILLLSVYMLYGENGSEAAYYKMKKTAYSYYESGKKEKAYKTVKNFITGYPQSARAKNLLAHFYYWEGKIEKSKKLLEAINDKKVLPEAKRLLARIETSLTKQKVAVQKAKTENKTVQKNREKKSDHDNLKKDLAILLNEVKADPANVHDRILLMHYFVSGNEMEQVKQLAKEVLEIDPENIETLAFLKEHAISLEQKQITLDNSKYKMDKIVTVLNRYTEQKAYRRFLNLYNALNHQNIYLPEYIHLDALNAAVDLQEYRIAKKILLSHDFPVTPHMRELRALLDQRLKVALSM